MISFHFFLSDRVEDITSARTSREVMNPSSSFAEAARRAFDNLSLQFQKSTQKSTEDDNFTEELERIPQDYGEQRCR